MGGMEVGSVWGHGSYVAPDWTADWLHREALFILDRWSGADSRGSRALPAERQAELQSRLATADADEHLRSRRRGTLTVDPVRAEAFDANLAHYADVFARGRDEYAIPPGTLDRSRRTCGSSPRSSSGRRGPPRPTVRTTTITYTSNWPHEPLVGNRPTGRRGRLDRRQHHRAARRHRRDGFWYASTREAGRPAEAPRQRSAARRRRPTPSQRAVVKYFWVVCGADPGADPARRRHGALRRRGQRLLRHPAREVAAVHRRAHLARAARHLLDRDGVARRRALHRPGGAASSRGGSAWASTCCSARCSSSSSARWPASG